MEISKIWLKTETESVVVLVEIDGKWYKLIEEYCPNECEITISYCAHVEEKLPSNVVEVSV